MKPGGIAILLSKGKPSMSKGMKESDPMEGEDKGESGDEGKVSSMEAFASALESKDYSGMSKALEDHYTQCDSGE